MAEKKRNYNFGEKKEEYIDGQNLPVWLSPKYIASKEAAISLLESKEFGSVLCESDFWILMNKTRSGKMAYTGLIISHDALVKINAVLPEELRFKEEYCSEPSAYDYAGKKGMMMIYRDKRDGMLEVGEITPDNCKNGYPFAMLFKRTFDRVVKRKANMIGFYSDSEADEFKGSYIDSETGEIISMPKKGTSEKEEKTSIEDKASNQENILSLEEALLHAFDGGSVWKGRTIDELVNASDQSDAQKAKYLNMYQTRGTDADKVACRVVADAIENGAIAFRNSVILAG